MSVCSGAGRSGDGGGGDVDVSVNVDVGSMGSRPRSSGAYSYSRDSARIASSYDDGDSLISSTFEFPEPPYKQMVASTVATAPRGGVPLRIVPPSKQQHQHQQASPPRLSSGQYMARIKAQRKRDLLGVDPLLGEHGSELEGGAMPVTPSTPFFDAQEGGGDREQHELAGQADRLFSDTVISSGVPGSSPWQSSEAASQDDVYTEGSLGSLGGTSFNSDADVHGPVTPSTPAWRPRELTLLRSREQVPSAEIDRHERERERVLAGLGIRINGAPLPTSSGVTVSQLPSLHGSATPGTSSIPSSSSSAPPSTRVAGRRLSRLNIGSTGPSFSPFSPVAHHLAEQQQQQQQQQEHKVAPRELKLSSSGGPPRATTGRGQQSLANARNRSSVSLSSPIAGPSMTSAVGQWSKLRSPSAPLASGQASSSYAASKSPLQVLPRTPAFVSGHAASTGTRQGEATASEVPAANAMPLEDDERSLPLSEGGADIDGKEARRSQRSSKSPSGTPSSSSDQLLPSRGASFAESSSSTRRKKGPPKPLRLGTSSPALASPYTATSATSSSYSRRSSPEDSKRRPMGPVTVVQPSSPDDRSTSEARLRPDQAPDQGYSAFSLSASALTAPASPGAAALFSPISPGFQGFHTPLSSPAVAQDFAAQQQLPAGEEDIESNDRASTIAKESSGKWSPHGAFEFESASSVDSPQLTAPGPDTFQAKESVALPPHPVAAANASAAAFVTAEDEDEDDKVLSTSKGADVFKDVSSSTKDEERRAMNLLPSNEPPKPPSPGAKVQFDTTIFHSPPMPTRRMSAQLVGPKEVASAGQSSIKGDRLSNGPVGPPPSMPLPTPPGGATMPRANSRFRASRTRDSVTTTTRQSGGGSAARPSRPTSVAQDIDERARISKGPATEPLPQSQWKASYANDIVAGGHSENNEDHEERSARARPVSSTTNVKVREAALEPEPRPRPPVPKTKTSLVPDVPSFAYGAPSSSGSSPLHPPDDQQPSNQAAWSELGNLTGEAEPQMSSRWSSGSDDDDDEPVKNKDKRLSSKQRKSSMTPMPNALTGTSRKASMGNLSSSGGTVQKKSGFFSGLGLRKKSVPNLGSAYAGSNFSNSPVTPSPSMAKAEAGLKEFPFPDTSSSTNDSRRASRSDGVSKHTSYAPSSMSFAAAGSHVAADPSSGRFSQQQLQQAPFRRPMAAPLPPQLQNSSSKGDVTMPKIPVSRSRSRSSQRLSQHDETDAGVSHFTAPLLTTAVNSASLKPKRSDASLGATVSSSSSEGTGRPSLSNDGMSLPSSPRSPDHVVSHQASFSSLKPLSASPKNAPLPPPSEHSRQRSIPGKAEIDLRIRKADDQDAPPSAPARMESRTAQSGRNKKPFEGSSRKDESGQGLDGTAARSAQRQPPQQPPQQIIGRRETQEVRKTTRQDPAPPLNLAAQRRVRSSSNAAFASPNVRAAVALPPSPSRIVSSPDETPRIAYASLPGSEVGSEIGSPQPTRMRFGEQGSADEEALTALGYAFARSGSESHSSEDGRHTSLSSSASSREGGARQPTVPVSLLAPVVEDVGTTPRASVSDELRKRVRVAVKIAEKRTRRVRSEAPLVRPHYPSLTDVGRLWVEKNAGLPFNAAHGPRLLAAALRQNSNEHGQDGSATPSESESSTDDYGSSDGGGGGREQEESFGSRGHGTGGGSGGSSGDGGDDGRDKPERSNNGDASLDDVEEEDDRDDDEGEGVEEESDFDSEDSYGSSEIPFPEANEAALDASQLNALGPARPISNDDSKAGESESDSSDDIPLGQRVQDPKQLQNHLRQVERSENIRSARLALEQPSSSSSANSDGRGPGRRARMLRAMQEQQARAVKEQAAMQCGKPSALDIAALSAKLAKVQTERETGGISEPPSAPVGSSSGQGVISRARSLKNPSSAPRHHHNHQQQAQQQDNSLYAGSEIQRFKSTKSERGPRRTDFHAPPSSSSSSASHAPPPLPAQPPPPHLAAMAGGAPSSAPAANLQSRQASISNSGTVAQAQALSRINPSARRPVVGAVDGNSSNGQVSSDGAFVTAPTSARSETDERAALSGNSGSLPATVMQHRPRAMSQSRSRAVPPPIDTRIAPPLPQIARMQAVGGGNGSPDGHRGSSSPSQSSISSPRETQGPLSYNSMVSSPPPVNREAAIVDNSLSQIAAGDLSRNGRQQGSLSNAAAAVEQAVKVAPASRLVQHRVFIVTRQRYSAAEVPLQARARDVVVDIMERETMPTDNRMGAWVLFDVCAELGLERPLREYELISDVIETRANPSVDFFLLKKTELAPYLALRSLPTSSPVVGGYVYVRDSKKKWNKRWLELRDHSLFHAKSEKGKDEVLVCHLSNFDVYLVDQAKIKTPKTHAFALRSQDPISLFESPEQDYMHVLSLSDGGALRHWVTSIINARTYVLKQERAALFALDPPAPKTSVAEAKEAAHPLPRTSIEASQYPPSQQQPQQQNAKQQMQVPQRKATVTTSSVAAVHEPIASSAPQTLIPRNAFAGPFEKGSLLASEAMKQPQLPPPSSLPQNQQQLGSWDNAAPIDLRVHERTRQRLMAEQRRQELLEVERARRRAREPLIQGIAMPAQHQQPIQPQAQGQPQAQAHQYRSRTSQQQPYQRR